MSIKYILNSEINPVELIRLFRQTDWGKGRSREDVDRMLKHTIIHLSAWHDDRLVGFARAITDTVYRAVIDDVIVDNEYRGRGIGSQLMKRLSNELSGVEEVFFGCDTTEVPFYEKLGYKQAHHPYLKRLNRRP
jgi:predicted GNAT family N-acyltransferase